MDDWGMKLMTDVVIAAIIGAIVSFLCVLVNRLFDSKKLSSQILSSKESLEGGHVSLEKSLASGHAALEKSLASGHASIENIGSKVSSMSESLAVIHSRQNDQQLRDEIARASMSNSQLHLHESLRSVASFSHEWERTLADHAALQRKAADLQNMLSAETSRRMDSDKTNAELRATIKQLEEEIARLKGGRDLTDPNPSIKM